MADDRVTREINKRAGEVYDLAVESGDYFTTHALAEQLVEELLDELGDDRSIVGDLVKTVAKTAVDKVDSSRRAPVQEDLFESMDRPVAVGGGRRVARRSMRLVDWTAHLANIGDNAARVNAAAAKENARFSALAPYLAQEIDTAAAAAAWIADHPGETLP